MSTSTTRNKDATSDALFNRIRYLEEYVDYLYEIVQSSTIKKVDERRAYLANTNSSNEGV